MTSTTNQTPAQILLNAAFYLNRIYIHDSEIILFLIIISNIYIYIYIFNYLLDILGDPVWCRDPQVETGSFNV